MINADGFLDWTLRLPRHPDKVYSATNTGEWITVHSIVGKLNTGQVPARFLSDARVPGQPDRFTDDAAASVMFILYEDGTIGQCYPITASTWTSGGGEANTRSWAVEAAGGAKPNTREKLTVAAEDAFIRLVREWEAWSGRKAVPGVHIRQHKDVAKEFGYDSTECASDRYSGAEARLVVGDDGMGDLAEVIQFLGGIEAIRDWNRRGNVGLIEMVTDEQRRRGENTNAINSRAKILDDHLANHGAQSSIPEHEHGGVKR